LLPFEANECLVRRMQMFSLPVKDNLHQLLLRNSLFGLVVGDPLLGPVLYDIIFLKQPPFRPLVHRSVTFVLSVW